MHPDHVKKSLSILVSHPITGQDHELTDIHQLRIKSSKPRREKLTLLILWWWCARRATSLFSASFFLLFMMRTLMGVFLVFLEGGMAFYSRILVFGAIRPVVVLIAWKTVSA
jgi:hypothetical protein